MQDGTRLLYIYFYILNYMEHFVHKQLVKRILSLCIVSIICYKQSYVADNNDAMKQYLIKPHLHYYQEHWIDPYTFDSP